MNINFLLIRLRSKWIIPNGHHLEKAFLAVILILLHMNTFAQSTRVTGTVKDVKGGPLPGVSVKVKGTTTVVATSTDGKYTLQVPNSQAVLVFTFIGFIPKEEPVGSKSVINVTLDENLTDLNEVVVTGYGGISKKRDLTGSISSVSAKQIEERQPINLFDALQGQAAGVLVVNDSGEPGAGGSVQVRGASTFSDSGGNGPLYVVDGVITDDGSAINPSDIENIEVLKDAASSSIYGARAANGVILITTKRGKEGKSQVSAQYSHVFGEMAHMIQQSNSKDLRLYRQIQKANNPGSGSSTDSLNPAYNSDNYLEDLLLGNTANKDELKLGVSGGQKGITYYSSLNYLDDRGIALNTWFKRAQSRTNIDFQISPKVKWSTNLSLSWNKEQQWSTGNSLKPVFDRPNNLRIYLPDGSLTSYVSTKRNPIANALLEKNETEAYRAQFNNTLNYNIYKDLTFTAVGNVQLDNSQLDYFQPAFLDDNGDENRGKNQMDKKYYWEVQSYLNYNKTIAKDHNITALLGWSADRQRYDKFYYEGIPGSFTSEEIYVFSGPNINITNSNTTANAHATESIYGRLGYNFKGRYILNGTFRRDGSSRFGPERKWGNFLSGSAAWRFSDEKFMSWSKGFLEDAKLRASIGQQGNDGIGDYESFSLINFGDENYNGIGGASIANKMGNTSIQWENTVQKDFGMDLSFFKGRLGFTADYYIKETNKLLADQQIPKETGFSTVRVNVGDVRNTGFELVVNGTPIATKNFSWNVIGNISFERGKVKSLINHAPFITSDDKHIVQEGGRLGDFYGYQRLGIYQYDVSNAYNDKWEQLTPVDVVVSPDGTTVESFGGYTLNGQPYKGTVHSLYGTTGKLVGGDTEWENVNKDSLINDADRKIIGNATPEYYLGIVNTLNYKRFSLSFIINATMGGQVYNAFKENQVTNGSSNGPALPEAVYGAWRKQGDIAIYPYFPGKDLNGNQRRGLNSYFLEDASFIRLSSVRFNYSLSPEWAKKLFLKGLNAYIYGTNLLTWTNYTGFDPEFSSNVLSPGVDGGKYPKVREVGLGINITL